MKKTIVILLSCCALSFTADLNIFPSEGPWTAPAEADKLDNPFMGQKAGAKGENLFAFNCERCHSNTGLGDGIDGGKLKPKPSDLTADRVQEQSDGALFWKISSGRGKMPAFKKELSEAKRWKIVNYLRELGRQKQVSR